MRNPPLAIQHRLLVCPHVPHHLHIEYCKLHHIITPLPGPGPRVYTAEYPYAAIKVPHDFLRSTNLGGLTRAGGGLGAFAPTSLFSPGREQWSNPNSPSPTTAQHVDTTAYTYSFFLRASSIDTERTLATEPSSLSDPRLSGDDGRIFRHRATLTDFALDHHGDHDNSRPRLFHLTTIHVDAAVPLLTSMIAQ
ncbi:hypothetical protein EV715DRAFT_294114 [Schizophyllum commune]